MSARRRRVRARAPLGRSLLAAGVLLLAPWAAAGEPAPADRPPAVRSVAGPADAVVAPGAAAGPHSVSQGLATVVIPGPELVEWGREVALRADVAVRIAARFWGVAPPPLHVVVDDRDERFNAYVDPMGGAVVHLRTRRPVPGEVGLDAPDPLLLLLVHEAVHAVHFGGRPGSLPWRTGLLGADLPWPPPSWLLEGAAVWAESRLVPGGGGRLDDAEVRGLLRILAVEGPWPSLADASLLTHGAWPAGDVRYLVGGAFVDRLIRRHGLDTLRVALRRFETAAPWTGFADAWAAVTGGSLEAEWEGLRTSLREGVEGRSFDEPDGFADGRAPARSPDGTSLAWVDGSRLRVAPWPGETDGAITADVRTYGLPEAPDGIAWWGEDRLVYARIEPTPRARLREIVLLDLVTGREEVLSRGARAYAPVPLPGGCLVFVRDSAPEGSSLRSLCRGGPSEGALVWTPPVGVRIVGLAASPQGRLVAVWWEEGATRLVELLLRWEAGVPVGVGDVLALPSPGGALRDPVWDGEGALLVRSDEGGATFESWRIDLRTGTVTRSTSTLGGVVGHAPGVIAVRRVGGPRLAVWPRARDDAPQAGTEGPSATASGEGPSDPERPGSDDPPAIDPLPLDSAAGGPAPVARSDATRYRPAASLRFLGAYPLASADEAGVAVVATDPAATLAVEGRIGVAAGADGPLGPVFVGGGLRLGDASVLPMPRRPAPVRARFDLGVLPYTPHLGSDRLLVPRADLTIEPLLSVRPPVRARVGVTAVVLPGEGLRLGGRASLAASDARADAWGVPRSGWAFAATAVAEPVAGGTRSSGAWADAMAWWPVPAPGEVRASAGVRVGWRPPRPVSVGAWGDAAASAVGAVEWTVPVRLRVADGRWALERLRFEPALRVQAARTGEVAAGSLGAELAVSADLVLGYGAPVRLTVAGGAMVGGGAAGSWLRVALPGFP